MAAPSSSSSSPPKPTTWATLKNAPVLGLAEGSSAFSNYHLAALVLGVPYVVKRILPLVNRGGFYTYWFLVALVGLPITVGYWTLMSRIGARVNERVPLPGKDIEEYIDIRDDELKKLYHRKNKIPMQIFHDAYFDGKIDFKGKIPFILFTVVLRFCALADTSSSPRRCSRYHGEPLRLGALPLHT